VIISVNARKHFGREGKLTLKLTRELNNGKSQSRKKENITEKSLYENNCRYKV